MFKGKKQRVRDLLEQSYGWGAADIGRFDIYYRQLEQRSNYRQLAGGVGMRARAIADRLDDLYGPHNERPARAA